MPDLFDPIEINGMKVPNRFVRSATHDRQADVSGHVTDSLVGVYEALASGGIGLIITGHAFVTMNGKKNHTMIGAHHDDFIPGLKKLAGSVHGYGSKIALQINHAGREATAAVIGETPAAPSPVYNPGTKETPRAFTDEEIETLIAAYGTAAVRAASAGFDAVQIHCAHGYLGSQFISPHTNRREDRWGGSLKNRMRFILEVYRCIRKGVGDTYPVMIKLNSEDFIDGGLTIEESTKIAQVLSREGIDAVEISAGMFETLDRWVKTDILEEEDEAYFLANARQFKAAIAVPLILVGGLRSPALMERLISDGDTDMVSLCRPFIKEPGLVNRWRQGDRKRADCISCNGCLKYYDEPVRCILLD
jgi:2,4-dienoyl-CoA reductase-like NADH-dependent reductase (Old Yellow Enzyme family)